MIIKIQRKTDNFRISYKSGEEISRFKIFYFPQIPWIFPDDDGWSSKPSRFIISYSHEFTKSNVFC